VLTTLEIVCTSTYWFIITLTGDHYTQGVDSTHAFIGNPTHLVLNQLHIFNSVRILGKL